MRINKYYVRGLGIGVLLTAIVFTIVSEPKMSDKKIMERASELGMVEAGKSVSYDRKDNDTEVKLENTPIPSPSEEVKSTPEPSPSLMPEPTPTDTPEPTPTNTPKPTPMLTPEPTTQPTPTVGPQAESVITATITIEKGMSAKKVCELMEKAGVISSAKDFREYLTKRELTELINTGEHTLSSDMSYKTMAYVLTKH